MASGGNRERADTILHNGRVLTVDRDFSIAEAVAIRDGRILAVGGDDAVRALASPDTETIDLKGKTVIPGLIDGHAHMDREGLKDIYPSLAGARTKTDILARIAALAAKARPGDWIVTMPLGDPPYHAEARAIVEETGLNRHDLDAAAPDNPVYIRSIWGFWDRPPLVAIANSAALRIAGVTRDTAPPYPGIEIRKDANGEPTGVFFEEDHLPALEHSLFKAVPRFTHDERVEALRRSMRVYNGFGTTGIYEGHGVAPEVVRAYRELSEEGALTLRCHLVISPTPGWYEGGSRDEFEAMLRDWAPHAGGKGFGDAYLKISGLFHQLSGKPDLAAIVSSELPYTGWASYYYDAPRSAEVFRKVALLAAKYDLRLHIITGTVAGVGAALDLYEEIAARWPIARKRWVIEHIRELGPGQAERMARLGIVTTAVPPSTLWKSVPPAAPKGFAPYKSLMAAGVPLTLCTDNVPPNPFVTLWAAMARFNKESGTVLDESECLDHKEALRAMTIHGAHLSFEEDVRGSIEPGKYADLVVIDRDYLATPVDAIKDIEAVMTLVGGRIVYRRG